MTGEIIILKEIGKERNIMVEIREKKEERNMSEESNIK